MKHAFVIAGTHSGVGKTTIATALMTAYRRRGMTVQSFKVGPDFIDPGFHAIATDRPSRNLDGWMLDKATNIRVFNRAVSDADIAIIEGVMGLFDGASATDESGSTAEMAKWLGLPVVLVIDAAAQARSAAALVHGFESFDPDLKIAAVIANNIAGEGHFAFVREALQQTCKASPIGFLIKDSGIRLPSRHLGLVTAGEVLNEQFLQGLSDWVESGLNLDRLLELSEVKTSIATDAGSNTSSDKVRIGIARDNAFCFYYQDNLDLLQSLGAELIYWSPINEDVPSGLHGLYFGGGYPELYGKALAANKRVKQSIQSFVADGGSVYAECGGMMFLTDGIIDLDGLEHSMVGILPTKARMQEKLAALGYVEIEGRDCALLPEGEKARGHQFRYSNIDPVSETITRNYTINNRYAREPLVEGYRVGNCLMSYIHLHFLSNTLFAKRWLDLCLSTGVTTG
ncbi:MAG TPA: cobyrinate a,c-diamide synthase [Blastocatellia bacterium]|nr:cobyrinate a,c-diamide synthase [Blastocatellia bacterium]